MNETLTPHPLSPHPSQTPSIYTWGTLSLSPSYSATHHTHTQANRAAPVRVVLGLSILFVVVAVEVGAVEHLLRRPRHEPRRDDACGHHGRRGRRGLAGLAGLLGDLGELLAAVGVAPEDGRVGPHRVARLDQRLVCVVADGETLRLPAAADADLLVGAAGWWVGLDDVVVVVVVEHIGVDLLEVLEGVHGVVVVGQLGRGLLLHLVLEVGGDAAQVLAHLEEARPDLGALHTEGAV
mmetsp:Transcript_21271/g.51973  ORF Transcript_21271/g.51973 Transcript_21271/m.51973 type:complete len:237 (+) Transcript_21271:1103-1813(+)